MENYLRQLILYTHLNPENHGVADNFELYPYSSYSSILSIKPTDLKRNEVIELFHDKNNFIFMHRNRPQNLSEFDDN